MQYQPISLLKENKIELDESFSPDISTTSETNQTRTEVSELSSSKKGAILIYPNTTPNNDQNDSNRNFTLSDTIKTTPLNTSEVISISSKRFQDNEEGVDSEHAWIIDIACFFVQFFVIGNVFSFGVFLPVYIEVFQSNQSTVSWVGSIGSCLMVFLGVFTGALDDRFGNHRIIFIGSTLIGSGYLLASFSTELWHLYLTHGLICGLGYSACFISSISIVGQWFKKSRGLAVGIAVAGAGIGQFGISQVNGKLIDSEGWRGALRYMALLNWVGLMLCAAVIRRRLPCCRHFFNLQNEMEFLTNKNFMFLCWGYMLFIFGMLIPNTYLIIYAEAHGISFGKAIFLLALNGLMNGFGRIIVGEIADLSFGRLNLLKVTMVLSGVATYCWISCTDYNSLLAFSLIYGFIGGGAVSLIPSIAADILGVKKISTVMGILYTISSFANLLSTPIAGVLADHFESYTPAIILSGTCQVSGVFLLLFMRMNMYNEASKKSSGRSDIISSPAISIKARNLELVKHNLSMSRKVVTDDEEEVIIDLASNIEDGKQLQEFPEKNITDESQGSMDCACDSTSISKV